MLDSRNGKVKMSDFGLAQFFAARSERLDSSKVIKSKYAGIRFVPPELLEDYLQGRYQLCSEQAHKQADIWAAGVTLYRLLTKEYPVKATSVLNLKTQLR